MEIKDLFAYYINLDKREDRKKSTIENLTYLGFHNEKIKRFSAIDGANIIQDLKTKNYYDDEIINLIKNLNIDFKIGEIGCMLSHYFLLKEINNNSEIKDDSIVFIFEDDFSINKEYLEKVSLELIIKEILECKENDKNDKNDKNDDFDMIYLGGRFRNNFFPSKIDFFKKQSENIYLRLKAKSADLDRTTHSYILKKKNINKICELILDNFKNQDKYIHQIDTLYNLSTDKISSYDYFPHIFYSELNNPLNLSDIQKIKIFINSKQF